MREIGDYLWLQLTECRHCGALESAAQAFEALCVRLWNIIRTKDKLELKEEVFSPERFLNQVLNAIDGRGKKI